MSGEVDPSRRQTLAAPLLAVSGATVAQVAPPPAAKGLPSPPVTEPLCRFIAGAAQAEIDEATDIQRRRALFTPGEREGLYEIPSPTPTLLNGQGEGAV
ncbi:MAG TPA: hypothetical protein VIO94_17820 [Phenylobacterium sp.]